MLLTMVGEELQEEDGDSQHSDVDTDDVLMTTAKASSASCLSAMDSTGTSLGTSLGGAPRDRDCTSLSDVAASEGQMGGGGGFCCVGVDSGREEEEEGEEEEVVGSGEELTIDNVFDFEDKAENFVMAALFCASEEGNVDGLKELSEMANNIDLSTANKHGETAVHMAASGGHVDVLKFLQDKGVNISIKDKQGDTAIYWAARQGHLEVIKCLHEAGLSLDSQNKSGETALHVAARYGHAHVVKFLCGAGANINVIDSLGETPLHSAAWHGYVPIVRTLCAHEALLDMQNKEGETVLHCAAVRGNLDCIKILLDHGAPLNHLDKRGSTALHLACQRHHSGIALMLLRAGCEMDIMDKETGESALHAASREGLAEVVQTLCSLGCKVDPVSADGFTPLHQAIKAGHIEITRCLLMSGAQPDMPNKDGVTGEIIALAQGFMEIAELMSRVKGDKGQTLIQQLTECPSGLSRIKLKVLGSTGVGKSLLIESLKCGFLGSFFRRRLPSSTNIPVKAKDKLSRQFSLPTPLSYTVANPTYTKGVDIQQATVTGAGDFSIWDFSGYEPYYMLYDHFLGDTHCLHLVTFSLQDASDEQLAQVIFWLNFLKARVPPALPIGHCGQLPNTPRVLLVATHADKAGCSRNSRGEYVSVEASTLHLKMQQMFRHDINLVDRVFIVDAQMATSADMKALKQTLGAEKRDIVNALPKSNGLLEATLLQLPTWRKESSAYPVLTWPDFTETIRSKVNPLASNDHMKLLVEQLQLMGEVVYLESESGPDLVVLSPRWLCVDVIGAFMSHDKISQARITGCFSVHEFQLMYPETDASNLLQVFEALEVCTQCEVDGEVEFEFPCLNFIETLSGLWQKDDERYSDAVYGGVRLHTSFQSGAQLKYLFPRIQVFLRRNMLGESEEQEVDLYQWHHGSKYCWGQLEGLIDMDHNQQFLEVKVRGPPDSRYALFFFLEDFVNVVEQVVENVCPGLCTERYTLSPSQLQQHGKIVRSYSPTELLRMQLENRSSVVLSGTTTENFLDIACMGSEEVLHHLDLGMDLDVTHLTIHTQRLLSLLLDPADPMGRDWCLLAVTLGLSDYLPTLDRDETKQVSQTQRVLEEWARRCDSSVRDLVRHLKDFNRIDAVEAILRTTPPFRTLTYEDQSTDESAGGAHGTDASTNTLSNLSR
ncbi:death-associated protein kinase dapk-1-like isoform X2 [Babylonia areolata]|uniref:death-associated protein kinase dapk-1-like isoform X2 n=1 Tax=Babylonia areolata TaxID=304850 RepID=UPI003FCF07D3